MENKTSYPVKRSFRISGPNKLKGIMAFLLFTVAISSPAQTFVSCFNMSSAQVCPGEPVTFTDCSGSISGTLTPGDGNPFFLLDASHASHVYTYTTPGTYNPTHVVNGGSSGMNSTPLSKTIVVVDNVSTPTFTIDNCAGNQVKVNITDSNYDSYDIAWGDGNTSTAPPSGSATYTYAATSTYSITVTGKFTSASCTSTPVTLSVTTLNALIEPVVKDLTVNSQSLSGSITLRYYGEPTQQYIIQEQEGQMGYKDIDTISYPSPSGPANILYYTSVPIPTTDPFSYRIVAFDACGSPHVYSDDIYSVALTGTASNHQNDLTWEDYHTFFNFTNFAYYDIYRRDNNGTIKIASNILTNSYTDNDPNLVCQQTYYYQIRTYTTTGQIAYSDFIPVTAISTDIPPTLTDPNVTYDNGQTRVVWLPGTNATSYIIQRSDNGGPYITAGSSPTTTFMDYGSSPTSSNMCYQVAYKDVCNNTSAYSIVTCPVLLQMTTSTTANTLNWNSYTGFSVGGIQGYEVLVLDDNGNTTRTIPVGLALTYTDPLDPSATTLRYQIRVIPNSTAESLPESRSNIVEISFAAQLYIPTAFSPNADGNNDKFLVKGRYVQDFHMTVFNQWGEAIFYSNDPTYGWDGTYKGENCVTDDYTWLVKAKDNKGENITEKGIVTLVR